MAPLLVSIPCPHCFESSGYVWQHGHDFNGPWSVQTNIPCAMCHGSGQVPCDEVQYDDERADDFSDPGYERALDAQAGAS